jgi:hypothetical protein
MESKDKEMQELRDKMAKVEESQLKFTEMLEVMKIAKSLSSHLARIGRCLMKKSDYWIITRE